MIKSISILAIITLFATSCQTVVPDISSSSEPMDFPKAIEFPSEDSLVISASLYEIDEDAPIILLCHQARYNKFEYASIAERLNALGFNCLAIDQRSGGPIGNKQNWTNARAMNRSKDVDYLAAEKDITAAIDFLHTLYDKKIILWGSSYSSTLAMYIAQENEHVGAVVAFSPGNYFADKKGSLIGQLASFEKPMFVTSSKAEVEKTSELLSEMKMSESQTQFIPEFTGYHGSKALWKGQVGGDEYWEALEKFLGPLTTMK